VAWAVSGVDAAAEPMSASAKHAADIDKAIVPP
jgi:hypothetical protein